MSFLGNSIGTSAGYAQSNSERSYEIKKGDTARMNISYNVSPFFDDFPDVLTVLVPEGYFDT
jgi:hypothetical protein